MIFACLFATATYLFAVFYWQRRKQMRVFKDLGIPGPEPNFLFGNLLAFRKTMMSKKYQEWAAEFGETFGYFEGPTPVLVTSNADVLQQVFVKQFNNFHSRKLWPVQVDPDHDEYVHLFFARGQRWKRLRSTINPAFTASKLRKMEAQVNLCAERLSKVIDDMSDASDDKRIEVNDLFRRFTGDIIIRCALGIDHDAIRKPEVGFLKYCQGVIDDTTKQPLLYVLGFIFPTLNSLWMAIYKFMHNIKFNPVYWLEDRLKEYITLRNNNTNEKYEDLLQRMLDAQIPTKSFSDLEKVQGQDQDLNNNCNVIKKPVMRSLTEAEVLSHALLFLLAGYETSSMSLGYIFYELATNPQVQEALRMEILDAFQNDVQPNYDNTRDLKYLDMVISESFRKYPLASTVIARCCQDTCTIGGLTIPSGMLVQANVWSLHRSAKHWGPDPESFDPLRFSPENKDGRHSLAWMPFGAGPRMCVGLRFATVQMKIVIATLLRKYRFKPAADLQTPLELIEGATVLPVHGIPLRVERIS